MQEGGRNRGTAMTDGIRRRLVEHYHEVWRMLSRSWAIELVCLVSGTGRLIFMGKSLVRMCVRGRKDIVAYSNLWSFAVRNLESKIELEMCCAQEAGEASCSRNGASDGVR